MNQNADPIEINKFNQLASRWWDTDGELKTLHTMNPIRVDYINSKANLNNQSVLDVGCGGGILSEAMATYGAQVTGIDLASDALEVARLHLLESHKKINYRLISVEDLAQQEPASFNTVTCLEMLEHVPDPGAIIQACAKLVKPGGNLFFSTINRTVKSYALAIIGAEKILKLLPAGTHQHSKFIKPSELDSMARKAELTLKHTIGVHYNPITHNFWLAPGLSMNYIAWFVRHE